MVGSPERGHSALWKPCGLLWLSENGIELNLELDGAAIADESKNDVWIRGSARFGRPGRTVHGFEQVAPGTLVYIAMRHIGAGRTGLISSTATLWGVVGALLLLGESLTLKVIGGGLLMLVGVAGFTFDTARRS